MSVGGKAERLQVQSYTNYYTSSNIRQTTHEMFSHEYHNTTPLRKVRNGKVEPSDLKH